MQISQGNIYTPGNKIPMFLLSWNIWRIRSNIGFRPHLRLLIPFISHFDSNRRGGRYKDILRKTDSRPKGFQASLFILRILSKFLLQMKLFILRISSGSYQNSQLAPSEGHFFGREEPRGELWQVVLHGGISGHAHTRPCKHKNTRIHKHTNTYTGTIYVHTLHMWVIQKSFKLLL